MMMMMMYMLDETLIRLLVLCFGKNKQHEAYEWYDVWNLKRENSEREWKTSYYKHWF